MAWKQLCEQNLVAWRWHWRWLESSLASLASRIWWLGGGLETAEHDSGGLEVACGSYANRIWWFGGGMEVVWKQLHEYDLVDWRWSQGIPCDEATKAKRRRNEQFESSLQKRLWWFGGESGGSDGLKAVLQ